MTFAERTAVGSRIRHACPARVDALTTVRVEGRSWVISAGAGTVRWWDVEHGMSSGITASTGFTGTMGSLAVARMGDGEYIVLGLSTSMSFWRWSFATGRPVDRVIADTALQGEQPLRRTPPMVVVDAGDGPVIVTGDRDGLLRRWDVRRAVQISEPWNAHDDEAWSLAGGVWSLAAVEHPDGTAMIVSGGMDGLVRCWDARTGTAYGPVILKCGRATDIATARLAHGQVVLCIASARGNIHRRDLVTGEPIGPRISTGWKPMLRGRPCRAHVAYAPAGPHGVIASCVDDHTVRLWDLFSGGPVAEPITDAGTWITAVSTTIRSDGSALIMVGDVDGTIRSFDPETGAHVDEPVQPHGCSADTVAACTLASGEIILAVAARRRLRCFGARTGRPIGNPFMPAATAAHGLAIAHLPDGRSLLIAGGDSGITRIDLTTGEELSPMPDEETALEVFDVATARLPDGRTLIAGAAGDLHRWDATTGTPFGPPLAGHRDIVRSVTTATRSDGTVMIISGDDAGYLRRWDALTGVLLDETLVAPIGGIYSLRTIKLPGGEQILVGLDSGGGVHQWNPFTGAVVRPDFTIGDTAYLIVIHVDRAGVPTAFFERYSEAGHNYYERWRLDNGSLLSGSLPRTFRTAYDDDGRVMMVLAGPDGSITIEPMT